LPNALPGSKLSCEVKVFTQQKGVSATVQNQAPHPPRGKHFIRSDDMWRFLALLCLVPCLAWAQPVLQFVEEANWPPYTPAREGPVAEGLAYAMVSEIGRRAGFTVNLELYPQKRLEQMVRAGERDGITVISRNAERETFLAFSDPLFVKQAYFFHLKSKKFAWNTFSDLKGMRIGVVRGHNLGDEFNAAVLRHGLILDEANNVEANFRKLLANRIDVLMANHWSAVSLLARKEYRGQIVPADKPYFNQNYHLGISLKSDTALSMLPKINNAIRGMKHDGTLDGLVQRYLFGEN
jgi:polar amino acid transport system substrate-binding protein